MMTCALFAPPSLGALLLGKAREAVVGILFGEPDRALHVRDIARRTGFSAQTIARELRLLKGAEVVLSEESGRQVFYRANPACPLFDELRGIARKTWGVRGQVAAAIGQLERIDCAFIFGSMATGTQHAGSDIDLLVIGSADFSVLANALSPVSHSVGRAISPKLYRRAEWVRKLGEANAFLESIRKGPKIFVVGDEGVLNAIGKPGEDGGAPPARAASTHAPGGRKPPRRRAGVRGSRKK